MRAAIEGATLREKGKTSYLLTAIAELKSKKFLIIE